jgi:hypothetical protein
MTVADPTTIDLVVKNNARGDRVTLVIEVPLTWADGGEQQLDQLIAKVNGYLSWVQTGECLKAYPESAQGVDFLVSCIDEPTGNTAQLLLSLHNQFAERYSIGVYFQPAISG